MTHRAAVEAAIVASGTAALWVYTAFFLLAANRTICLFAVPPWYFYLPQDIVAVVSLAFGVWAALRASDLLRSPDAGVRVSVYLALAVALCVAAGVRLFYVVGSQSMCFYPP